MTDAAATRADAPLAPPRWTMLAAVFVGGALGTVVRAALADPSPHEAGAWPWATLVVNVVGAFAIGAIFGWLPRLRTADTRLMPFLTTGICGGLTTFATLQVELVRLVDDGDWGVALGYAVVSLAAGYGAVVAGRALTARSGDHDHDRDHDRRGAAGGGAADGGSSSGPQA